MDQLEVRRAGVVSGSQQKLIAVIAPLMSRPIRLSMRPWAKTVRLAVRFAPVSSRLEEVQMRDTGL